MAEINPKNTEPVKLLGSKEAKQAQLRELEERMGAADFWTDKVAAQAVLREISQLKDEILGAEKYDKGDAIFTIFLVPAVMTPRTFRACFLKCIASMRRDKVGILHVA